MCRVQPSLRARGWPARGEPHDRPREQEFRCGSPRGGASRPHPRLVSGALRSLELLLPSPVAAHGAERTQPPSGTSFLGDVRGWGALGFICITQTARGGRPDGCHRGNRAGSGAWAGRAGASRHGPGRLGVRPGAGSLPSLGLRSPEEAVGPVALHVHPLALLEEAPGWPGWPRAVASHTRTHRGLADSPAFFFKSRVCV